MPDFSIRIYEEELMDDLNLSNDALRKNLDELEFINYWLGGNQVIINALNRLYKQQSAWFKNNTITIADLGTGGGDVLRTVAKWSRRKKIDVKLIGYDANQFMIDYASAKATNFPEISFKKVDIFSGEFKKEKFDIVLCSLFCHHFTDEELVILFKQLALQSSKAILINDLHRHPLAYYSIKFLTKILGGSYLVQNDAPLSVLRAFKKVDLKRLFQQADISTFQLRWLWAFRYQAIIEI